MRSIHRFGPSIAVFAAAVSVLLVGPHLVRRLTHAQTEGRIRQAASRLEEAELLDSINRLTRDVATLVEPSVVHVSTSAEIRDRNGASTNVLSSGSGWVYDANGHIVSNAHVVDGADRIEVQLYTGESYEARLVGLDLRSDIAVLRVASRTLVPARRGSSNDVRQGDLVFAFGSPFDFRFSMSSGIVSGVGRAAGLNDIEYENFIQVDAAINPGNSGGPLTNTRGEVVGMNTAIATGTRGNVPGQGLFAGIGLAIPMSMIESIADQLIATGEVERGYVGLQVQDLTMQQARDLTFNGLGVLIDQVKPGGPADRAGLRQFDIITHVDGQPVDNRSLIPAIVSTHRPGEVIRFRVWRLDAQRVGTTEEVEIALDPLDPAVIAGDAATALRTFGFGGLETLTPSRASDLRLPATAGVLISNVLRGSPAEGTVEPGSVVVSINGQPVANLDQLYTRMERQRVQLGQRRGDGSIVYTLGVITPTGDTRVVRVVDDRSMRRS